MVFKLWYSRLPDVGNLHIFGCDACVHILKEQRQKLDDKAGKLTFVGYSEESNAFRLMGAKTNRIKIGRDIVFLDKRNEVKLTHTEYNEVMPTSINTQENSEEIQTSRKMMDRRKHHQEKNLAQMRISVPMKQPVTTDNNQEKRKGRSDVIARKDPIEVCHQTGTNLLCIWSQTKKMSQES